MNALLRVLSPSYLRRHSIRMALAVAAIAVGVATFVSVSLAQQTLAAAFVTSVARLAGHADLQITAVDGVPESLQETIRALPVVAAAQPVIEQVVQPAQSGLGGLLVIAVDLVGDQEIRDYPVSIDGVVVDDPLIFLAKPDSIALAGTFAARAGLAADDPLRVKLGGTTRDLVVRALLPSRDFTRAFGGNVGVMDVYAAQDLFGRGRRFDRVEVRLKETVPVAAGAAAIRTALGPGFQVDTPERRGAELQRLADTTIEALDVVTAMAVSVGVFLVFNVFKIAVDRRRRDIGILRTLGATPAQMTGLFLCEAAVLGLAGGVAGAGLGRLLATQTLAAVGAVLQATRGLSDAGSIRFETTTLLEAIALGVAASLAGAWSPAREASRVPPVDALATGAFAATPDRDSPWHALTGVLVIAAAYLVGHFSLVPRHTVLLVVTLAGAFGAIIFAGRAALLLIAPVVPWLRRLAPAAGRVAADALLQHRRTRGTAAALTVAAAFVLGTAGFLQAVRASFDGWIANVITTDLIVRATTGWGPSATHLPAALQETIERTPGVRSVDGVRSDRIDIAGDRVTLMSVDRARYFARVHTRLLAGAHDGLVDSSRLERTAVVSSVFATRHHVAAGDTVMLPAPTGPLAFTVVAVIAGDRSAVTIERTVFATAWRTDRVDAFYVGLEPGANPAALRATLQTRLGDDTPALISTREEFVAEITDLVGLVYAMIRGTVLVALLAALLGVALSQLVVVAERARDIGILRAIGAVPLQIGGAVVLESILLAAASLVLAVPLGDLLSWLLRGFVAESLAGFQFARAFPVSTLLTLVVALPLVGIGASLAPARWAIHLRVPESIGYE